MKHRYGFAVVWIVVIAAFLVGIGTYVAVQNRIFEKETSPAESSLSNEPGKTEQDQQLTPEGSKEFRIFRSIGGKCGFEIQYPKTLLFQQGRRYDEPCVTFYNPKFGKEFSEESKVNVIEVDQKNLKEPEGGEAFSIGSGRAKKLTDVSGNAWYWIKTKALILESNQTFDLVARVYLFKPNTADSKYSDWVDVKSFRTPANTLEAEQWASQSLQDNNRVVNLQFIIQALRTWYKKSTQFPESLSALVRDDGAMTADERGGLVFVGKGDSGKFFEGFQYSVSPNTQHYVLNFRVSQVNKELVALSLPGPILIRSEGGIIYGIDCNDPQLFCVTDKAF